MSNIMRKYTSRLQRILKLAIEIKCQPRQSLQDLIARVGVSRAQFYKDREFLKGLGFQFHHDRKNDCFVIDQDCYLPAEDLSLSERFALIMAVRQLSTTGDYFLSYHGFLAARKLISGLQGPLRESVSNLFDDLVFREGFGCDAAVLEKLQLAISESRRVRIRYQKPSESETSEYEIDPYSIFFRKRSLYLEAFSVKSKEIRTYRVSRMRKVEFTAMHFQRLEGYDFAKRNRSVFSVFGGEEPQRVAVRFNAHARPYIEESLWHHSQKIVPSGDGGILLTVEVAEPREVLWWAMGWGADAEIVEPAWLREEARESVKKMSELYG
jgi:predicted DNA-binding transcriptional regulator YafY